MMATNEFSKIGVEFIKHFKENPLDYPEIILRLQKKTIRYYEEKPFKDSNSEDYMEFYQLLDLFDKQQSMQIFLVEDLLYKSGRAKGAAKNLYLSRAVQACSYYGNKYLLRGKNLGLVNKYMSSKKIISSGEKPDDTYGPITEGAFTMPNDNILFVNDPETVKMAKEMLSGELIVFYIIYIYIYIYII